MINMYQSMEDSAYPEYVIDEETSKQDTARADSVQLQKLNTIQCESQSKQIVGNPVLQKHNHHLK